MRRLITLAVVVLPLFLLAKPAGAQALRLGALPSPEDRHIGGAQPTTPQTTSPSIDPWYAQYYTPWTRDARALIIERAQFQAQQRQLRIASRAWFGISASRPLTTADIMFGDRAPRWVSGSATKPYHWTFVPPATLVLYNQE